MDILVIDNSW
jgi:hypothetical protein